MSFVGMGNQWGKRSKKDRVDFINSVLEKMTEKQLMVMENMVLEVIEVSPSADQLVISERQDVGPNKTITILGRSNL